MFEIVKNRVFTVCILAQLKKRADLISKDLNGFLKTHDRPGWHARNLWGRKEYEKYSPAVRFDADGTYKLSIDGRRMYVFAKGDYSAENSSCLLKYPEYYSEGYQSGYEPDEKQLDFINYLSRTETALA